MKSTTLENIAKFVYNHTNIDVHENSRDVASVDARTLYYVLARETTNYTCNKIGKHIGKSHATVLHSLKNKDQMYEYSYNCRNAYDKYQAISDFSTMDSLIEKIRDLESEVHHLSKDMTEYEVAYRNLCWEQQQQYDEKAKWTLKSFGWKNREANRKEVFEIINCSE